MKARRIERRLILLVLSLFMALVLLPDFVVRVHAEDDAVIPESDYLTFTAEEDSSVTMKYASATSLQYKKSTDTAWQNYTAGTAISLNNGDSVCFRGNNVTFDVNNHVNITGKVACSGNIMSLRMDDEGKDQGLSDGCFCYMFYLCTGLTTAPKLPAATLAEYCYYYMFCGCTGLTTAPSLSAENLAQCCYAYMFYGCTGLTTAPELPATTLEYRCYEGMFDYCTGLTTAPELPATTLAEYCYYYMFCDCTGLTTAPALPATTLAKSCYERMFQGCTGIKLSTTQADEYNYVYRIPSSGTGEKADEALSNMFKNTGGAFTGTPNINTTYYTNDIPGADYLTFTAEEDGSSVTVKYASATSLQYKKSTDTAWQKYIAGTAINLKNGESVRFRGNNVTFDENNHVNITGKVACSGNIMSLRMDDEGQDQGLSDSCFRDMFYGCTGLTTAPKLPATTLAQLCYYEMFYGCTGLTAAPELSATNLAQSCYSAMFCGCTGLTTAPGLPATDLALSCYSDMFFGCTGLTEAPELPATNLAERCYYDMFSGCTGLTSAPELPAENLAKYCYAYMFYGCTGLKSAPELPATNLAQDCYSKMFYGCTGLTTAPALPAENLAKHCYAYMFYGCTGLTSAPTLPATTLADYCYYRMFSGCTGICISETKNEEYNYEYRIPSPGPGTTADSALNFMFSNTGGTFAGTPRINTTYYMKKPAISQIVTFKVVNGYWDDETNDEITVTLTGFKGDTLKLSPGDIPSVGNKPAEHYKAGSWDTVPSTDVAITEEKVFTYTYAENPKYRLVYAPGEGGSGEMTSTTVYDGEPYTFPACTFDAPEHKTFDHWKMNGVDGIFIPDQAGNNTVTISQNCVMQGKITVTAYWQDAPQATVTTAPEAKNVSYNGTPQILVTAGEVSGGTMKFALGTNATTAPTTGWSTDIPTGVNAQDYYVWYKAVGDDTHSDSDAVCVTAKINPKAVTIATKAQTIKEGEKIQTGTDYAILTDAVSGHTLSAVTLTSGNGIITPSKAAIQDANEENVTDNYSISYVSGDVTVLAKTSCTVTFKVVNGSWNDENLIGDQTVILEGYEGDTLKLTVAQIPSVGNNPAENYKEGSWDSMPSVETSLANGTTKIYTYTYAAKKATTLSDLTDDQKPAPKNDLKEDGKDQVLVLDPKNLPEGYTIEFSTDGGKTWTPVPTGKDSGEYTIEVFYKADENHTDFFGDTLNVIIQGVYNQTDSDGDWTKGSGKTYTFRIKKAFNDEVTYDNLTGVFVDGKKAEPGKDYTPAKGSAIITFAADYLETLSVGEHKIRVTFKDGEVTVPLKVLAAIATPAPAVDATPTTGDTSMPILWTALILMSMAGVAVMVEKKRRRA